MIANLREVFRAHKQLLIDTRRAIRETLLDVGSGTARDIATKPQGFKHRTGTVAKGTRSRFIRTAKGALIEMKNIAKHARVLSSGSEEHEITPRGGALSFMWKGKRRAFARVWHPGTRPTHFLDRATDARMKREFSQLRKKLDVAARRFNQ